MADILKERKYIEHQLQQVMGVSEEDHFWLRIDMQRMYLREVCHYPDQMYKRLTASYIFQNWWIVQCLHIEKAYLEMMKEGTISGSQVNYKQLLNVRLQKLEVESSREFIIEKVLQHS